MDSNVTLLVSVSHCKMACPNPKKRMPSYVLGEIG